jgi:hypothetical protein
VERAKEERVAESGAIFPIINKVADGFLLPINSLDDETRGGEVRKR